MEKQNTIKLHLGCGPHFFDGWRNYDGEPHKVPRDRSVHFKQLDLRDGLPIADGDADFIFTEHFIEHIDRFEGQRFLVECARVLKPGGVLRISTPNLQHLVYNYVKKRLDEWAPTWVPDTPAQLLNEGMRSWGHKFLYDFPELYASLARAGFREIYIALWHDSEYDELRNLEVRPYVNDLILEAVRP